MKQVKRIGIEDLYLSHIKVKIFFYKINITTCHTVINYM